MKLHELNIEQAAGLLKKKEVTSEELTRAVLDRIDSLDDKVGAYLTVDADGAMEQARAADRRLAAGQGVVFTGIPLGIKDLICTRGLRTTCASRMLENYIPPYDAGVIERLKTAGAVILGKLNMDEFAMGSTTEHSGFQVTRNPWDLDRIPGGSSGGSGAAVAADMCLGALGSDTGGSIRQPASHCGVVGIKPTYGRVSRYGLVAFASSLDQIGPLGKTVGDCAIMLDAIAGHDPRDSTSVPEPVPTFADIDTNGLDGMVVGIPKEYQAAQGMDPQVKAAVDRAVETITSLGARSVEVSLPHTDHAVAAYYVIAPSEASSNLARYDGVKYGFRDKSQNDLLQMYRSTRSQGFGAEVQRRIILGTYALSAGYYDAYYGKASQVRTLIKSDFQSAFDACDVILSPVAPTPAFRIGETVDDPLTMYLSDIFTLSANLAGIPGISVPCGFSDNGLPIGLQIMARHFNEAALFKVARQFEAAADLYGKKPPLE
ncbi:MAG: Asp-tRNA(Asn)/Glu-tRNA(Gln) amidotransferase GatCAB subunit A [Proteobacteria bacterium]|nr:MAG: Asp-tRNA(Asn)/Glu-tRNA(Gln) amidotransferase GatCAB subunit A [Pseudomonadota bacterium]